MTAPLIVPERSEALDPTARAVPVPEYARTNAGRYVQPTLSVLLAVALLFIVSSNLLGWTAHAQVTKVTRHCEGTACEQQVVVQGRQKAFVVPEHAPIAVGDVATIHATCTPGCDLGLVGIKHAGAPGFSPIGGAEKAREGSWLTPVYSRLFLPHLSIIGTIQNTLTGLVQLAWIFVLAQIVFPAVRRRPKLLSHEMRLDVMYILQTQLLYMTAAGAAVGVSTGWLQKHTPVLFPGLAEWPFWLQVIAALWMYDFVVYWRHRLEHQLFFLWPIHAVHHTTQKVDVFTTTRLHPLELMAGGILNMWITARFGIGHEAAGFGFMLYLNYNYFVHTNVKIVYPRFLKYILVSPFMHRWHHAREPEACDKNFGVIFAWNDWLFGTAYHPGREPNSYGIDYAPGEVARDSYIAHLFYPLQVLAVRSYRRLASFTNRRPSTASGPA